MDSGHHGVRYSSPRSPGDLATEQFLEQKLIQFGLAGVRRESVPVNHWASSKSEFVLADGQQQVPCFAIPYTAWTPGGGVEAELAYVAAGTRADFEAVDVSGKLAVVDMQFAELSAGAMKQHSHFVYDPDQTIPDGPLHAANWLIQNFAAYYEAFHRDAVGFIGLLSGSPIDSPMHYVPYDGYLKDLPGVWIGRDWAEELIHRSRRGTRALLTSAGNTDVVNSHNVVATVLGTGDESIVISCHHDAPFASAVEDASGLAVLLWLARRFAAEPGRLSRNLVFVASSGHFHGGVGNRMFVQRHRDGLLQKTVAAASGSNTSPKRLSRTVAAGTNLPANPKSGPCLWIRILASFDFCRKALLKAGWIELSPSRPTCLARNHLAILHRSSRPASHPCVTLVGRYICLILTIRSTKSEPMICRA